MITVSTGRRRSALSVPAGLQPANVIARISLGIVRQEVVDTPLLAQTPGRRRHLHNSKMDSGDGSHEIQQVGEMIKKRSLPDSTYRKNLNTMIPFRSSSQIQRADDRREASETLTQLRLSEETPSQTRSQSPHGLRGIFHARSHSQEREEEKRQAAHRQRQPGSCGDGSAASNSRDHTGTQG